MVTTSKTVIREATGDDLGEIFRMGRAFADAVGVPFDEDSAAQTAVHLIEGDDGVLLIGDGAMAGALAYPLFLNHNIKAAQELFWWVDKDRRGNGLGTDLLESLEQWAQSVGADQLVMLSMHASTPQFIDNVYLANGYKPFEKTYIKVFQNGN